MIEAQEKRVVAETLAEIGVGVLGAFLFLAGAFMLGVAAGLAYVGFKFAAGM